MCLCRLVGLVAFNAALGACVGVAVGVMAWREERRRKARGEGC